MLKQALGPLIGIALFSVALAVLHHALAVYRYQDIISALRAIPSWQIVLALLLAAVSYLATVPYDLLALRYIGRILPLKKVGFTTVVSYAFSNTIGLSVLTSGSVRYRLYSSWGLSSLEIAKVVMFSALTLWLGLLTIGGFILLLEPMVLPSLLRLPFTDARPLGFIMLALVAAYLLFSLLRRRPLQVRHITVAVPAPRLGLLQALVGAIDWTLIGTILYVLLPPLDISYIQFLSIFLLAQTAGLASHVPGGVGVFESLMLLMLPGEGTTAGVAGALIAYRLVYYLLPLALAALGLGLYEGRHHTQRVLEGLPRAVGAWIPALLPQALGLMALVSGALLLFSSATPAVRLEWLRTVVPLPVVEISHLIGSLAGVGLILLARALQHRLKIAWWLAVTLLSAGIVTALLKDLDYPEALVLAVALTALLPARSLFYREAPLLDEPLTGAWITTLALILLGTLWLGLFSYKHLDYSHAWWWQFSFEGDAPRLLRAMLGVGVLTLGFTFLKWLRPMPAGTLLPEAAVLRKAQALVAASPYTYAHLALFGDKTLLFNKSDTAFLMYAVQGQIWAAMGDPIASSEQQRRELAWEFRELCERHSAWAVFYQVYPHHLDLYIELGLTLLKIGKQARVPLAAFSLRGPLRALVNRIRREGCRFEIIEAAQVTALLPQLKAVSDTWLALNPHREKKFAVGFFNEHYLPLCPLVVVRRAEQIVAFASLWRGAEHEELSVDLLRYSPAAPDAVNDFLLAQLMLWGKRQGYRWFNLGVIADLDNSPVVYNRFGAQLAKPQALRRLMEKYQPYWEPRYLAAPADIALPRIFTSLRLLIEGEINWSAAPEYNRSAVVLRFDRRSRPGSD